MKNAFNVDIRGIDKLQSGTFKSNKISEFFQDKVYEKTQNGIKVLDGRMLEESWFKPITADVFISHKSDDVEAAKKLGAYLQSKGKSVFIDSQIWGNISKLQTLIDNDYCLNSKRDSYIYENRNKSTSYTHMLLATALLKTIRNCDNFVFLNTRNSIKATDIVNNTSETNSPWIFFELNVANSLITKVIQESRATERYNFDSMPEMAFAAELNNFKKVDISGLFSCLKISSTTKRTIY